MWFINVMPKSKEENAKYMREWREKNKERLKEIIPLQQQEYNQSPAGIKAMRKASWKRQGIIVEDFDKFYESFLSTSHCQFCKKELTTDNKITDSTRVPHHDHDIKDKPNVIAICCQACNAEHNKSNTSGEVNIHYYHWTNKWFFQKRIKGEYYKSPYFKTKQEAQDYKLNFLKSVRVS